MGWWNSAPGGESLMPYETGLMWGDGPADIMDRAIEEIAVAFKRDLGRPPTLDELVAGLRFSAPKG
jgi:hypothetical protein